MFCYSPQRPPRLFISSSLFSPLFRLDSAYCSASGLWGWSFFSILPRSPSTRLSLRFLCVSGQPGPLAMGACPRGGWQLPLLARLPLPALRLQSAGLCPASSGPLVFLPGFPLSSGRGSGKRLSPYLPGRSSFTLMLSPCCEPQFQWFLMAHLLCRNVCFLYS